MQQPGLKHLLVGPKVALPAADTAPQHYPFKSEPMPQTKAGVAASADDEHGTAIH